MLEKGYNVSELSSQTLPFWNLDLPNINIISVGASPTVLFKMEKMSGSYQQCWNSN
jgi:hypothetical protein